MKTQAYLGEHDLRSVYLTPREKTTLTRAAEILQELRERLEDGRQDWDDGPIVDIALAAHTCRDVVAEESLAIS